MRNYLRTKKLTVLSLFCALTVIASFIRIPVVLFLKYEPKDIFIVTAGFIFGPAVSLLISLAASFLEMILISDTGIIGFIMNVIASCSFACTAAYIYQHHRSRRGAVTALLIGCVVVTAVMLLWNYLITPIYMGYPREAVAKLLLPVFLPFNLLKYIINTIIVMLIYKPIITALYRSDMIEDEEENMHSKTVGLIILVLMIVATVSLFAMSFTGMV